MKRKWVGLILLWLLGVAAAFWWYWPDGKMRMIACDVNQGDSILITRGFSQVVIDGGPGEKVLNCLGEQLPFWDRRIEVVVLTHPDADHYQGLTSILGRYQVGLWMANGMGGPEAVVEDPGERGDFDVLVNRLRESKTKFLVPQKGDVVRVGKMELAVLWPPARVGGERWWTEVVSGKRQVENIAMEQSNSSSIVIKATYGNLEILLTGDIGEAEELALVQGGLIEEAAILKVAHHGSKFSTTSGLLERLKPQLAVISVGRKNPFGHPARETLMRLEAVGAKILRTDQEGDIIIVSDGERWWVR